MTLGGAMWLLWCAGAGAALGSFAACAAWRIPRGVGLCGRSRCPACGAPIPWHRNVPVLSWLLLRGRAACCGARLSARYVALEAAFAAAGLAAGLLLAPPG